MVPGPLLRRSAVALTALALAACGSDPPVASRARCDAPGSICTVVGTGTPAFRGEGAPPHEAALFLPIDLAFDEANRLVILDWNNFRVRRLDGDNRLRTIMGTGREAAVIDGAPALETPLHHSFSMARDGLGGFYLAGNHEPRILYCSPDGRAYVAAGRPDPGLGDEDVPALEASFGEPCGVAVGPDGRTVYVADTSNHRIRRIDASGRVTTIAGDGTAGHSGDGGPAIEAELDYPSALAFDARGDLWIADTYNNRVRLCPF